MEKIGEGASGVSVIADSISTGGEPSRLWQASEGETWLSTRQIEQELGIPIDVATQFGLQLRGNRCRLRAVREWSDAIKSLATKLK